jgi:hypothetical protein
LVFTSRDLEVTVKGLTGFDDLGFLTEDIVWQLVHDLGVSVGMRFAPTESGELIRIPHQTKYYVPRDLPTDLKKELEGHYQKYLREKNPPDAPQGGGANPKHSQGSA